jgi:hemolysin activation/secretion protein
MVSCHWWREGRLAPRVPAALIAFFASRFAALLVCCSVVAAAVHAQAPRVTVNEVAVTGNTLLPPEQLDAALARFRGELTLDDLKQAAQTVQALYRQAGYGSVVAYVPEQSVAGGRATIAVVEGRITRVHVVGNNQFSEANILRSLPSLKTGVTPRISQIDNEIQLANENPAKQMSLTLEPGQGAGEVDARVVVVEQQPSSWTFALDNTGNESTGMLRAYLRYQNAALWDLDHVLSLQVGTSVTEPSSAYAVAANYRIPFYKQGMTVDLFAAYSKADAGTTFTPAGGLQFSGNGEVLGLLLNKYLQRVGEFEQQLGLGLDLRLYLNDCRIEGLPSAACGSSGESVTVNPLSLSYRLQRGGSFPLGLSIGFSQNLGLAGPNGSEANFEAVRAGAPKYYWLGRLGGFGGMPLPEQWQLQARFSGQFTPDALVWGEQFGIAGATTVRGYIEREVIGDQGVAGSIELYAPAMRQPIGGQQAQWQVLGFADAGKVWNHLGTPCVGTQSVCPLASLGVGLRADLGTFQLRLDVAYALKDGNNTSAGDTRANFLATYVFR